MDYYRKSGVLEEELRRRLKIMGIQYNLGMLSTMAAERVVSTAGIISKEIKLEGERGRGGGPYAGSIERCFLSITSQRC